MGADTGPGLGFRSYDGLVEYRFIRCSWQGLQTRSGLILEGRGSSFVEQALQKVPLQFLHTFCEEKREVRWGTDVHGIQIHGL